MTARLFLGCGSFGRRLAERLQSRPGSLLVLTDEESRVRALREENVRAEAIPVDDPGAVRTRAGEVDTVVVASDDPSRNLELAAVARDVYPDAFRMAYTGEHPTGTDREALSAVVDRVVDHGTATVERLGGSIDETGYRTRRLRRVLRRLDGPLAVVTHDNPDPDAIASAVALAHIAERTGLDAEVCYYGSISHQENRAFVNLLEYDLTNLDRDDEPSRFGSVALVDHSRPGVNDGLPEDIRVDIVVDHHPPRAPVEARFVDLRSSVGATSTLLTDYLRRLDIQPGTAIATGLLFGIRVDTKDFSREVSPEDYRAAAYLLEHADVGTLERIESPSMTADTIDTIGRAIENRDVRGEVAVSCVGGLADRDALAQAADALLDLEGVSTTFVFGYTDEMVFASARARGTDLDLGEALRDAFDQVGSAGGHADMAGAQLPIGMLVDEDDEDPEAVIEEVVVERFFEGLQPPDGSAAFVYTEGSYLGSEAFGPTGRDGAE